MSNCSNDRSSPFNVRIVLPDSTGSSDAVGDFEVRGIPPIKVVSRMEGRKKVFIVSYSPSVRPTCQVTANPQIAEVGVPTIITYTLQETKGSADIQTRVVSPDQAYQPEFDKQYTFMDSGLQGVVSFTITDEEGQTSSCSAGVQAKYRFYRGTIERNGTTYQVPPTSALGSSIQEAFPRQEYGMDLTSGHFMWLAPAHLVIPTPTGDGNFPFEIMELPNKVEINGIEYKAVRTKTSFVQNGKAILGF